MNETYSHKDFMTAMLCKPEFQRFILNRTLNEYYRILVQHIQNLILSGEAPMTIVIGGHNVECVLEIQNFIDRYLHLIIHKINYRNWNVPTAEIGKPSSKDSEFYELKFLWKQPDGSYKLAGYGSNYTLIEVPSKNPFDYAEDPATFPDPLAETPATIKQVTED